MFLTLVEAESLGKPGVKSKAVRGLSPGLRKSWFPRWRPGSKGTAEQFFQGWFPPFTPKETGFLNCPVEKSDPLGSPCLVEKLGT